MSNKKLVYDENTDAKLKAAADELLESAKYALSVIIKNGIYEYSDKQAKEKLEKAILKATK